MVTSIISAVASIAMAVIAILFIFVGFIEGSKDGKSGLFLGVALIFATICFLIAIGFAKLGGW